MRTTGSGVVRREHLKFPWAVVSATPIMMYVDSSVMVKIEVIRYWDCATGAMNLEKLGR